MLDCKIFIVGLAGGANRPVVNNCRQTPREPTWNYIPLGRLLQGGLGPSTFFQAAAPATDAVKLSPKWCGPHTAVQPQDSPEVASAGLKQIAMGGRAVVFTDNLAADAIAVTVEFLLADENAVQSSNTMPCYARPPNCDSADEQELSELERPIGVCGRIVATGNNWHALKQ